MTVRIRNNTSAFTTIEVLITLLILGIIATMTTALIGDTDAGLRAERAARECLTALRCGRAQAIATGNTCGVRFDTAGKKFWVWQNATPATALPTNLAGGGTYVIDLVNNREIAGATMTVSIPTDTTNPYDVQYTPLGATTNTGTVSFTYGGKTHTVTIPAVGDPTYN